MNNNEDKQEDRTNPGFEHTFKRLEVVSQKLEAGGLILAGWLGKGSPVSPALSSPPLHLL